MQDASTAEVTTVKSPSHDASTGVDTADAVTAEMPSHNAATTDTAIPDGGTVDTAAVHESIVDASTAEQPSYDAANSSTADAATSAAAADVSPHVLAPPARTIVYSRAAPSDAHPVTPGRRTASPSLVANVVTNSIAVTNTVTNVAGTAATGTIQ